MPWDYYPNADIQDMLGKTFTKVTNVDDRELRFEDESGRGFVFYHDQNCCESVTIEDICGDLEDLVGSPILMAEEVEGETPTEKEEDDYYVEQWTFYKFATVKGYVTVRWYGTSNGYYSTSVDLGSL